ncbi:glycoside hydrolase family 15 protein [Streptomyces sp. NBC_00443]|uniref:glycoside hydrolase family 15 protein n=1 Tax=Streptomyces sp. NBC_00443 TaxID=2975743 RepID=UPI003FA7B7F9
MEPAAPAPAARRPRSAQRSLSTKAEGLRCCLESGAVSVTDALAVDRALTLADDLDASDRVHEWTSTRDEIAAAIEENGWDGEAGAYTQAYGSGVVDASALMMPVLGFIPADAPDAGHHRRRKCATHWRERSGLPVRGGRRWAGRLRQRPPSGQLPTAFSHIGLINAAWAIHQAT